MAEERRIKIVFETVGATEGAAAAERFKQSLVEVQEGEGQTAESTAALRAEIEQLKNQVTQLEQAQQRSSASTADLEQGSRRLAQETAQFTLRIAASTNAIASMANALGNSALGGEMGLIGKLATAAGAGAQLGLTFGPGGALVGGILGAAIPAIDEMLHHTDPLVERMHQLDQAMQNTARSMREGINTSQMEGAIADRSFRGIDDSTLRDRGDQQRARQVELQRELDLGRQQIDQLRVRNLLYNTPESIIEQRNLEQRLRDIPRELLNTRSLVAAIEDETERRHEAAGAAQDQVDAERRRIAASQELHTEQIEAERREREAQTARHAASTAADEAYQREQQAWEDYNAAVLRGIEQQINAKERENQIDQRLAAWREQQLHNELAQKAAQERVEHDRQTRAMARMRDQQEADRRLIQANQEHFARSHAQTKDLADLVGGANDSLIEAMTAIATGSRTADEAFKNLLASFLKMIATKAGIAAGEQYAAAIASFADMDEAGGAEHLAAAIAYTAVAVGAGAAGGALSSSSGGAGAHGSSSRPESPDRSSSSQQSSGKVTYVTNWNAPVAVAGSEEDAGRMLGRLGKRAAQRYGRLET